MVGGSPTYRTDRGRTRSTPSRSQTVAGRFRSRRGPGIEPVWSRDGTELLYRDGRRMMAVAWDGERGAAVGGAEELFEGYDVDNDSNSANYDVARDGRFLMIRAPSAARITVVLNWFAELKARVLVN